MSGELADFRGLRVVVIGDVIVDRYVSGEAPRISPEAPVPVVHVGHEELRAGGAANVAANLASLGARPQLLGVVGKDDMGRHLREEMKAGGVGCAGLLTDPGRPTVQKTRILARHQQVLRVDREVVAPLTAALQKRLCERIRAALRHASAVVLSDYGKGVLTPEVLATACDFSGEILVDPKGRDFRRYRGATLVTPNASEAAEASGIDTSTLEGCRDAAAELQRQGRFRTVVITRGAKGIYYRLKNGVEGSVPARARGVFDVTGAGDTVIAVLALAAARGLPIEECLRLANAAAGLVVERLGAATVTPDELAAALRSTVSTAAKVTTLREAARVAGRLRTEGRQVVMTNGCFDLMHPGHVESLEFARSQGDFLIVAVNEDDSVRRQKDDLRPVQALEARMRVLAGLSCVDLVFAFAEDTPRKIVEKISPGVLVKGEDWKDRGVVGREWVEAHGGRVVLAPLFGGHSTSALIERIQEHPRARLPRPRGAGASRGRH